MVAARNMEQVIQLGSPNLVFTKNTGIAPQPTIRIIKKGHAVYTWPFEIRLKEFLL
jgi:hypothetical protein